MVHVSGRIRFRAAAATVMAHLEQGVRAHAVAPEGGAPAGPGQTTLTRYSTRMWFGTVVTTEEATIEAGRSVAWRHVDGPLTGSVETFSVAPEADGGCVATYRGAIRARHPLFRGPLEHLFVAPATRRVSLGALQSLRRALDSA